MKEKSQTWTFRVRGALGHWGGVKYGPERMSQPAPSHSAVVGMLRSLFGKNEYRWQVETLGFIEIPKDPHVVAHNGYKSFNGKLYPTQIHRVLYHDIDLVIRAHITRSVTAGPDDPLIKAINIISDRARQGAEWRSCYIGLTSLPGDLEWVPDESKLPPVRDHNLDLGMFFYDRDFDLRPTPHYMAPLAIKHGVITYPSWDEVKRYGYSYFTEWAPGVHGAKKGHAKKGSKKDQRGQRSVG